MKIMHSGRAPSGPGPENYFTGQVRIDPLFQAEPPGRAVGAHVTFEPGARTAWHTHPAGQTLIVTFGRGLAARDGGPVEEIRQGDVVWIPAAVGFGTAMSSGFRRRSALEPRCRQDFGGGRHYY